MYIEGLERGREYLADLLRVTSRLFSKYET